LSIIAASFVYGKAYSVSWQTSSKLKILTENYFWNHICKLHHFWHSFNITVIQYQQKQQ